MARYTPPSITDKGLKNHLNATKDLHNGYDYADFVKMVTPDKDGTQPVNKANIARLFKVNRLTVDKWIAIYKEEAK